MAPAVFGLSYYSHQIDPRARASEVYFLLFLLGWMCLPYVIAVIGVCRKWRPRVRDVLLWAVLFRVLLLPSTPILETDYYRYLWDGFVLSNGLNPYEYAPTEFLQAVEKSSSDFNSPNPYNNFIRTVRKHEKALQVLEEVNHPEIRTIYPPFAQILFGISSFLFPCSEWGWRLVVLFFDFMLIGAILLLLMRLRMDPVMVIVYAWSPLVLKEYVNTLHLDGIALALLFLAILLLISRFFLRSGFMMAAGVMVKYFPLMVMPYWVKRWTWGTALSFLVAIVAMILMFMGAGEHTFHGTASFAQRWESNSSLVVWLEWLLMKLGAPAWGEGGVWFEWSGIEFFGDAFLLAKVILFIGLLVFIGWWGWRCLRSRDISDEERLRYTFLTVSLMILFSPVANPWYIAWCVPFLCFFPRLSWLYLSCICFVYYTFFITHPRSYPEWARPLEYVPFYLMFLMELVKGSWLKVRKEFSTLSNSENDYNRKNI